MTYKEKHNLNIKIFHCKLSYQNYCIIYSCTITLTAVHLLPQKEEQGNINFPSIQKTQSTCGCWDKLSSKQNYCWRSTVCLQFAIFFSGTVMTHRPRSNCHHPGLKQQVHGRIPKFKRGPHVRLQGNTETLNACTIISLDNPTK